MLRILGIGVLFAAVSAADGQTFEAINNCRQLVEGADRVACYDALKPADVPAPATPKVEPVAATEAQHIDQSCGMLALGGRGVGNCQDGDVAQITDARGRDVPDLIATFCDFGSQILTFPDSGLGSLGSEPRYVVLCKYHQRAASSKKTE